VSYLRLGHVFVANMTGNVVFLGFSVDPSSGLSTPASLIAIAGFLIGALAGGRLAHAVPTANAGHWLAIAFTTEAAVLGVVAALTGFGVLPFAGDGSFAAIRERLTHDIANAQWLAQQVAAAPGWRHDQRLCVFAFIHLIMVPLFGWQGSWRAVTTRAADLDPGRRKRHGDSAVVSR